MKNIKVTFIDFSKIGGNLFPEAHSTRKGRTRTFSAKGLHIQNIGSTTFTLETPTFSSTRNYRRKDRCRARSPRCLTRRGIIVWLKLFDYLILTVINHRDIYIPAQ